MSEPTSPKDPDLTAVLVDDPALDLDAVRDAVERCGLGDVWVRVHPLAAVGLTQVEVFDPVGQPKVSPSLVEALSARGRAVFVHRNGAANQAMLHPFAKGTGSDGWLGAPEELDARLGPVLRRTLREIVAADDGTRVHPFVAASDTFALVRGRSMRAVTGLPIALANLVFHDRGFAGAGDDRVALLGYDAGALERALRGSTGAALSVRVGALPESALGPLAAVKDEVVAELAALGDETPEAAGLRSVRALELLLLAETFLYAGGDGTGYFDQRFLPLFSLTSAEPPLDDADEAEALEERASVLEAMVEVLPFASPEGAILEQVDDAELRPLAPWAVPGEEYVGSIFAFDGARVRGLLAALDQRDLAARVDRFFRAWWKVQTDEPVGGEAWRAWREELERKGSDDVNRFFTHWAEWRVVLETAAANGLATALLFYS